MGQLPERPKMAAAAPITLKEALLVRHTRTRLAIAVCALDWVFRKLLGLHLTVPVRNFGAMSLVSGRKCFGWWA